jgi:predicted AAA+ superfamily ATPase
MLKRHLRPVVEEALSDTPAVLLVGARQTGKTTLVKLLAERRAGTAYLTMDDSTVLDSAQADPEGLLAGLPARAVIDEIQRAPGLLLAMKAVIDLDRKPGRFLLTGSADVLSMPRVAESLAGRMEVATLWPLSQGELSGHQERFVDALLAGELPGSRGETGGDDILDRILRGGFPEAVARERAGRRRAFFDGYVTTLLQRDVRDIADIERPAALRRLLQLISVRTGSILNRAELSRTLGLPVSTLDRYLAILQTLFLVQEVPAWASNRGKRLVRAPKVHVVDSGLAASLTGLGAEVLKRDRPLLGPLLESFVAAELRKQIGWSETRPSLFHFRTHAGREVDLVLEDARGRVVGLEVKSAAAASASDFEGLRTLAETAGKAFVQGVVLYLGRAKVPFGPCLTALPLNALWAGEPGGHRP